MVKNLPANAGDTGSIRSQGKVFALIKKIRRPALCQVLTGIRDRAVNKIAKISTLMKLLFCGRQYTK